MAFDTLIFERREAVAIVTLNRPDKLNALNIELVKDLRAVAATIDADCAIRAVLLTGAGRAFSSGADLTSEDLFGGSGSGGSMGRKVGRSLDQHFNPMVQAWFDLSVPVVVAVNGVAAGAGMSLALLGDIVLAAHSATFLLLFAAKLGLMPDLGSTYHLPRLIGTARAKGLALLGEPLSAADAARWGLIWAALDDETLMPQALAIAQRFAAGPTQAFKRIKAVFNEHSSRSLPEQLALESVAQAVLADTEDFAEGVRAFRTKRAPTFTGN